MSVRFHRLRVAAVESLTEDAGAVTFAVPPELAEEFSFRPGQSLTLRRFVDGVEQRRSYSLCSPVGSPPRNARALRSSTKSMIEIATSTTRSAISAQKKKPCSPTLGINTNSKAYVGPRRLCTISSWRAPTWWRMPCAIER